jgi:hypothetical protein
MPVKRHPGWAKPAKRKQAERRAAVRFTPAQEVRCHWSANGSAYTSARVCDISAGGACLLVRGRLAAGTRLTVELVNGPHTCLCVRQMRVLRVYQGGGHDAVVCGSFDRKLEYDELLPFVL